MLTGFNIALLKEQFSESEQRFGMRLNHLECLTVVVNSFFGLVIQLEELSQIKSNRGSYLFLLSNRVAVFA